MRRSISPPLPLPVRTSPPPPPPLPLPPSSTHSLPPNPVLLLKLPTFSCVCNLSRYRCVVLRVGRTAPGGVHSTLDTVEKERKEKKKGKKRKGDDERKHVTMTEDDRNMNGAFRELSLLIIDDRFFLFFIFYFFSLSLSLFSDSVLAFSLSPSLSLSLRYSDYNSCKYGKDRRQKENRWFFYDGPR